MLSWDRIRSGLIAVSSVLKQHSKGHPAYEVWNARTVSWEEREQRSRCPLTVCTDGRDHLCGIPHATSYFFSWRCRVFHTVYSAWQSGSFKSKYLKELTDGYLSVPQLLVNNAGAFNETARKLYDLGFQEINLNIGCPSNTVYAKHKGAGMLRDLIR